MGIGISREHSVKRRHRKPRPSPPLPKIRRSQRGALFRRRSITPTTSSVFPLISQSNLQTTSSSFNFGPGISYPYLQTPLFYSAQYNNGYSPSQPLMFYPQRPVFSTPPSQPIPYPTPSPPPPQPFSAPYNMQMPSPYVQQTPMQPAYNNYPSGQVFNPASYPMPAQRLLTDWTGGGQISPGFLGPPL